MYRESQFNSNFNSSGTKGIFWWEQAIKDVETTCEFKSVLGETLRQTFILVNTEIKNN